MPIKVLVVDDNANNVRLLKDILEDENYAVYAADNGLNIVETVHCIMPDAILLDIMMPGLDGFEICKALKNDFEIKDIPVIMITAKTEGTDIKKALELGAFDYIKKPIDEVEVVARLQSALRYKNDQDRLRELASKDGLTGIYNHALLVELFEKEFKAQERDGGEIAFVMLDIDHFKRVNDTCGHTIGDLTLKSLADILLSSVRSCDIVGRYGGEEFSIILPSISRDNSAKLCERIRQKVEEHVFSSGNGALSVTISIGICVRRPSDGVDISEMIKKADEALYRAKENGRNRVETAE